jgi:EH signature protein
MSSIDRLQKAIAQALNVSLEPPEIPKMLTDQLKELEQALSGAGAGQPPRDRMREAIERFRRKGEVGTLGDARLICFGCAEQFDPKEPRLIEVPRSIPTLLESVDRYSQEPRSFRRCYRGLLHVYFAYDGDGEATQAAGRENWRELRSYLNAKHAAIRVEGMQPEWAEAIGTNPNLLTADPASPYARDLLNGDAEEVNQIKSRLEIQEGSWLMRRLILAQIITATRESDNSFKRRTERLLAILEGHSLLENEGLALILERYAKILSPEPLAALRERAIRSWGNPTFRRHSPEWSRVSETAKRMISTWATLDIIREFFEVLSEDRRTDQRRLKFWQRYHDQIEDMYFALGSTALYARDADRQRVRKKMGDRLLILKRGGSPSNNAFIMLMGDIAVVEFGVKGNACYLYRRDDLPFALRGEVTGDGLKSTKHLARVTHMDGYEKWEEKFATALASWGVRSSGGHRPSTTAARPTTPRGSVGGDAGDTKFNRSKLEKLVREHHLVWVDNTDKGGNISVISTQEHGPIADTLRTWGFSYSEKRWMWWRKDWA